MQLLLFVIATGLYASNMTYYVMRYVTPVLNVRHTRSQNSIKMKGSKEGITKGPVYVLDHQKWSPRRKYMIFTILGCT